jgi:charged multivesicular body protein 6
MQKMSELVELNEFRSIYDEESAQGIGSWLLQNVVVRPASLFWWSNNTQNNSSSSSSSNKQQSQNNRAVEEDKVFVVMKVLRERMDYLVNTIYQQRITYLDLFLAPSQIREMYFGGKLPQEHINLVLCFITHEGPGTIVKLSNGSKGLRIYDNSTDRTKNADITQRNTDFEESYRGIIQLKESLYTLEKQRRQLHSFIDSCVREATEFVSNKQRDRAKWVLTRKKLLESVLDKRERYITSVHELLARIEQASTDIEVIERLHSGSQALNQLNNELNTINVEQTLDDVAQSLSDYADIQQVMDIGIEQINTIDTHQISEEDLLRDLEALTLDVQEEQKQAVEESEIIQPAAVSTSSSNAATVATPSVTSTPQVEQKSQQQETTVIQQQQEPVSQEQQQPETKVSTPPAIKTFPQPSDIPVESLAVIEYEMEQLKTENRSQEDIKKLTDHLNLSAKLLRLKLKKYQKNKNMNAHAQILKQKIESCEEKATQMQTEGKSEEGLRVMKYISLMEDEVEEIESSSTSSSNKSAVAV